MTEVQPTILIVEDDLDVAEMLDAYFVVQGYRTFVVYAGEDAVHACRADRPDLIILDIRLPDIDGYEVARRLRTHQRTLDIPIIFLTERRSRPDRLRGLGLGADDYITKPFDVQELGLRARNALRRSAQGTLTNPVTVLPEGALVDERLKQCLASDDWAILTISIENLDRYREVYGFVASDDVLRAAGLMIHNAIREVGEATDFIGHLSRTKFVLVTLPRAVTALQGRIHTRLTQSLDYFYPLEDRQHSGYREKRLEIHTQPLFASQGPFHNLETLKSALSASK